MKRLVKIATLVLFTVIVAGLTWAGFQLYVGKAPVSPFWPSGGFVLAALIASPRRHWPAILVATGVASGAVDGWRSGAVQPIVIVPVLEPLVGAVLIRRFAGSAHRLPTLGYWARSMLCGPVVSASVGASIGASLVVWSGSGHAFLPVFWSWWFADALGQIVVTPAVLALHSRRSAPSLPGDSVSRRLEFVAFFAVFASFVWVVFISPPERSAAFAGLRQGLVPILIWSALRMPSWVSFNALAVFAGLAAWRTSLGQGAFVSPLASDWDRVLGFQIPTLMQAIGVQMLLVLASERKQATAIQLRSDRRFRDIVETTNEWIWEVDAAGRFVYSSPHSKALLDYEPAELIGRHVTDVVAAEDIDLVRAEYEARVARAEPIHTLLHRSRCRNGSLVFVETNAVPIFDAEGRVVGCRGADRDVGKRVAAEEEAREMGERIAQSEKLAALGTVVSGVAHEINNPNQFITLNLPILKRAWSDVEPAIVAYGSRRPDWQIAGMSFEQANAEISSAIDEIADGSERIRAIVAELKEFLQGERSVAAETVDLIACAEAALRIVAARIAGRSQRVELLPVDGELPKVLGNARRIGQVVTNLLTNASEALGTGPGTISIRLAACQDPGQVCIEVRDDGPGIAEVHLVRVFDPFYTTKRATGGTGLGLAISSRIAREHGGRLEIDSRPGSGTVVRLLLPVHR